MERFYYGKSIAEFLVEDSDAIFGILSKAESFDTGRDQKNAWMEEIGLLKSILQGYSGHIFFEYSIPRLGKRADVILVINGVVLCLEFKVGTGRYEPADREQVWDYALDLKNFHEPSWDLYIAPILVATDAPDEQFELRTCNYDEKVFVPLEANGATLKAAIDVVLSRLIDEAPVDGIAWARGRYSPTPTIIQAASALYAQHNVDDITDVRSSLFLEDVATEFDIQGLEFDWTCLIWDGDFQYADTNWIQRDFSGGKWKNIKSLERQAYQLNAYRVLLTRARKGMVICVPEGSKGNPPDNTRKPEYYDCTYNYLKSLGLKEI